MNIIEKFYRFETSFDLKKFTVNGFWYYPLIKMAIYFELVGRKGKIKSRNRGGNSALFEIWHQFIQGIKWRLKSATPHSAKYLFFDYALSRRQTEQGYFENIYNRPLMRALNGKDQLLVEFPAPKYGHHKKIDKGDVYFLDWDIFLIFIKARLRRKRWIFDDTHLKELYDFLELSYDPRFINDRLNKTFLFIDFYRKFLSKVKPQIIFLIDGYDYKQMALIASSKKLGIPTVELQHGLINESHLAYMYAKVTDRLLFADYLFTFGPYFTDLIKRHSVIWDASHLVTVGFPYLELVKDRSVKLNKKLIDLSNHYKIIYITSQWTVRDKLRDFVLLLSEKVDDRYRIFYKIHPGETNAEQFYEPLKNNAKIELILDKTVNSLEIMKIAFVHSTVYSTSYFESVFFELPNIFIDVPKFSKNIEHHIDNKTAFIAKSVNEYLAHLAKIENDSSISQKLHNKKTIFYAPNALKNILSAVNNILKTTNRI